MVHGLLERLNCGTLIARLPGRFVLVVLRDQVCWGEVVTSELHWLLSHGRLKPCAAHAASNRSPTKMLIESTLTPFASIWRLGDKMLSSQLKPDESFERV